MIRVLQVLGTIGLGGAESRVMDLYRHMDRDKIGFDFLVTEGTDDHYRQEIEDMGGRVYHLPAFRIVNLMQYKKACNDFFRTHCKDGVSEYAAVHGHMTSTASIYLPIAKKWGVPLTIAHARSAGIDPGLKGYATRILRANLYRRCDKLLACSDMAGDSVFGKGRDYEFIPNAIDTKALAYDVSARRTVREKYGISDNEKLIGHVGSFRFAKNHGFIIDIMAELIKEHPEYKLMLVGDGGLKKEIEDKVSVLGLKDRVIFTGSISPVAPYYSAFDVLLFPSVYEGMPGTVVEAEAAGLVCLISDSITGQVVVTDKVTQMSLARSASEWADRLVSIGYSEDRSDVTTLSGDRLSDTLYDVNKQVGYYMGLYGVI